MDAQLRAMIERELDQGRTMKTIAYRHRVSVPVVRQVREDRRYKLENERFEEPDALEKARRQLLMQGYDPRVVAANFGG